MEFTEKVFDRPHATALAEAKREFFDTFLPEFFKRENIKTAADLGCGLGYFTKYLKGLGLRAWGFDAREENIKEAQRRHPDIDFNIHNIEERLSKEHSRFDAVFCLGLIYHLENPFLAIKNIAAITEKVCIIETVVSPYKLAAALFVEEGRGQDQSLNYIAQVPTEAWLIQALERCGFPFIYKTTKMPVHPDFRRSFLMKKKRIVIVAAKNDIKDPMLKNVSRRIESNKYMWYAMDLGKILEYKAVRKIFKLVVRIFKKDF